MADITLLNHITVIAEREIAEIKAEAEAEAARITETAETEAERIITGARKQVQAGEDRIREQRINSVRFAHNAQLYDIKSQAITDLWREAETEVAAITQSDRYPSILAALFFEGAAQVPDGAQVHVSSVDVAAIEKLTAEAGRTIEVVADDKVYGGVAFHWPDGGTVLINTLAYRLARLRNDGNAGISNILFAADGEAAP